jgi:uncharacterized protein YggE
MANRLNLFKLGIAGLLIGAVALGSLNAPRPALAQGPDNKTIVVVGLGTASGVPDVATISLGVEVVNENAAAAFTEANRLIEEVTTAVKALGVEQSDIRTTGVNIYSQPAPVPSGDSVNPQARIYQANIGITITVADKGTEGRAVKVGEVIDAAIAAGANAIYGISMGIEDPKTLENEARTKAIEDARSRAEVLAQALGVTVGEVIAVEEVQTYGPIPLDYGRGGGGGMTSDSAQINQGTLNVNMQIRVTFALVSE